MILHPEIVRGYKGTKISRQMWARVLGALKPVKVEGEPDQFLTSFPIDYNVDRVLPASTSLIDQSLYYFLRMIPEPLREEAVKKFAIVKMAQSGGVYRYSRDFYSALSKVSLKNIPFSILPAMGSGFISIPETENEIDGFYYSFESINPDCISFSITSVYSGAVYDDCMRQTVASNISKEEFPNNKAAAEAADKMHAFMNTEIGNCMNITFNLRPDSSIEDAILAYFDAEYLEKTKESEQIKDHVAFGREAFNAILYIYSQEPDLQKPRSYNSMTNRERKQYLAKGGILSEFSVPVTYVSWNYKKPQQYQIDSTWVDSHPRWQPCGPGRSQVKLIWVAAHERTYKTVQAEEKTEALVE